MGSNDGRVAGLVQGLYQPEGGPRVDFRQPAGEPALAAPDSVSWRVFKNPVSLFIGGVTAVILELAEPRVRTGVWEHSSFRSAPLPRLKRTGLAAMVTVYGARGVAETMIAGVRRMHDRVTGDEFSITHEYLSIMLGVRRTGVTDAMHVLEGRHLIVSTRSRVVIRDRAGLIALASGAYGPAEGEYVRLTGIVPARTDLQPV